MDDVCLRRTAASLPASISEATRCDRLAGCGAEAGSIMSMGGALCIRPQHIMLDPRLCSASPSLRGSALGTPAPPPCRMVPGALAAGETGPPPAIPTMLLSRPWMPQRHAVFWNNGKAKTRGGRQGKSREREAWVFLDLNPSSRLSHFSEIDLSRASGTRRCCPLKFNRSRHNPTELPHGAVA